MPMRRSPELRPTVWDGVVVLAVVLLAGVCLLAMSRAAGRASGWEGGGPSRAMSGERSLFCTLSSPASGLCREKSSTGEKWETGSHKKPLRSSSCSK